jgi:hypothetical protein
MEREAAMTDVAAFLLNSMLICLESIMIGYLGNSFFQRTCSTITYATAIGLLGLLECISIYLLEDIFVLRLLLSIFLSALWVCIIFRTGIITALFSTFLFVSYATIIDSLFLMTASLLAGERSALIYDSPFSYYLLCYGAKALELVGIVVLSAFVRHCFEAQSMRWTDWLRTLFFPIATLVLALELVHIFYMVPNMADTLALCACVLLLADILSIYLLDHLEKQQIAIRNNAILQQNLKNERDSIASWVTAYQEERKRSHDFQNQLSVLRGMVATNTVAPEFLEYLDSLLNVKLPATRYINTNRPVADVLLSQKAAVAKSKEIQMQLQLDDLSKFYLPDEEMVVVLANLLDNAIEACEKITVSERRCILVKIQCNKEASYLYIENATATPVQIKNNHVVKQQKSSIEHGFGLQNVSSILERRGALYDLCYQEAEAMFCFSAQLLPIE